MKCLSEIITRLNHDKDLNSVVSVVNKVLLNEKKRLFNIEDLVINNRIYNVYILIYEKISK